MTNMFAAIVLGHLAGDYLLQNRAMMLSKSKPGQKGRLICTLHCLFYTLAVCVFLKKTDIRTAAVVFASHWFIDRWSLAAKWMALIKSRQPGVTYRHKEIDAAFYAIVYTACDNAMHLILMWIGLNYTTKRGEKNER